MSQTTKSRKSIKEMTVVDIDVHVMNPKPVRKAKAAYMSPPYSEVMDPDVQTVGGSAGDGAMVEIPGQWQGAPLGAKDDIGIINPETDIEAQLVEEFGVDVPIINMGARGVDGYGNDEMVVEAQRATNNVLLDRFLDENEDYLGVATVATSQPDKAAEEIDRMANEEQIVGLYTNSNTTNPPLGNSRYNVMYEAAEDNGFSFVLHSPGSAGTGHLPYLPREYEVFLPTHTVSHPASHMINLISIIYEGVPARYPDVNFIWTESGLGWAAYMMGRMSREWGERRFDAPLLDQSPEAYIRSNCYFGNQPIGEYAQPTLIHNIIDIIGAESIVFASDFPHFDFDYPEMTDKYYGPLSNEERERIFAGNVVEALGIEDKVAY